MNVLSLCDGMSCGQIALEKIGIKVEKYYAAEIKEIGIKVTKDNYPNTIQLGDVKNLDLSKLPKIDLLIGGSPCQNLSITVINNLEHNQGLKGDQSILFYEYVRIFKKLKPTYFLLENVASMKDSDRDIITKTLGVEPIRINSNLVSAQDRDRYHWTNIKDIKQPNDKQIKLKYILQNNVDEKYFYKRDFIFHGEDKKIIATLNVNAHDISKRVYNPNFKCGTLTKVQGGYQEKKVLDGNRVRKLTPIEYERLQTLPDDYTKGFKDSIRYSVIGDGWTVDVISHIFKGLKEV